ncbi:MAG TPA: monomeric [FeFe] hydrogenase [Elusimicrobiales bacterium]|nr:monomeric [FeFe] hydrogenase [Elusimicrobiales bacterium]
MEENNIRKLTREAELRVVSAFLKGKLPEAVDRIPLEMCPATEQQAGRCCVYKGRAIAKYRVMAVLGFGIDDETDELTPLAEYAHEAQAREKVSSRILSVITPACSSCPQARFYVSDACRGCTAHPCQANCPKHCVSIVGGKAELDAGKCVNCGRCQKVCPFHAIIHLSLPCEESCPVGAISKDEHNKVNVDFSKCIYCGRCITACPFGAVVERSQLLDVLRALRSGRRVYALAAPAIAGQWEGGLPRIVSALMALGFHAVKEVAAGADAAARLEAEEFLERGRRGLPFMTTSCCQAYMQAVQKVLPEIRPFVSGTPSPLQLMAKGVKADDPERIAVFIGPCIAKRRESMDSAFVDYYLTFSEVDALFEASGIKVPAQPEARLEAPARREGRGFPLAGGVLAAVVSHLPRGFEAPPVCVNGLNKASIKQLRAYAAGGCPARLVEVMACEGGCINGPDVVAAPAKAKERLACVLDGSGTAYDGA